MKEYFVKFGFNLIMFGIGVAILLLMLNRGNGGGTQNHIEVKVTLSKKPEIRNYNFTNPTVYKEKTIEYSTNNIITKDDSDRIVRDYLIQRQYFDSIYNDTAKVRYHATVEKNSLKKLDITYSYKPKEIHIKETKTRKALLIGLAPGWDNGPTIGMFAGFEADQYSYGFKYDPIKNPNGGYLFINKRIFFRK